MLDTKIEERYQFEWKFLLSFIFVFKNALKLSLGPTINLKYNQKTNEKEKGNSSKYLKGHSSLIGTVCFESDFIFLINRKFGAFEQIIDLTDLDLRGFISYFHALKLPNSEQSSSLTFSALAYMPPKLTIKKNR